MVFNGTFNNISVISWWSVLLVKETRVFFGIPFMFDLHIIVGASIWVIGMLFNTTFYNTGLLKWGSTRYIL